MVHPLSVFDLIIELFNGMSIGMVDVGLRFAGEIRSMVYRAGDH